MSKTRIVLFVILVISWMGIITPPSIGTPVTVSQTALPTVQISGIVWAQVTVGKTVYATGRFTKVRAPGSAPGVGETTRSNILAYDIETGGLLPFKHTLNGEGKAIAASPDGTKLYVGGLFTAVDGQPRSYLAAFNIPSGTLIPSFNTGPNGKVLAITATPTRVFVGGGFQKVGSASHPFLAAFNPNGGVISTWQAKTNSTVAALVVAPAGDKLIVGGSFSRIGNIAGNPGVDGGVPVPGLGAITVNDAGWAYTGVNDWGPTDYSFPIRSDDTVKSQRGITSLTTDGKQIYGSTFNFQDATIKGSYEGTFAISSSGRLIWADNCHGDTYSTFPVNGLLYSVGHAHDCSAIGGFKQTDPWVWNRALVETTSVDGVNVDGAAPYYSYKGLPRSSLLSWMPKLSTGLASGAYQAAWSVTGTADGSYIALGGEFTKVNGVPQQGLVRFKR